MQIKRYRNWPILAKVMIIPLISLLAIIAGTEFFVLPKIDAWLLEQEKVKVRSLVEVAYQQIVNSAKAAEEGHLPLEEAQKHAREAIKQLRYSGSEYFWLNDLAPRMVMHPTKPELDGTDLSQYKDPRGKLLFMEFVKVCKEKGEGFVDYLWPKPGESQPVPKVSYVKLYQPWGWIIGSGLYVDAFTSRVAKLHVLLLTISVGFSCALMLLAWSVGRGIKRSLDKACRFAAAVAAGDLSGTLELDRSDEVGVLGDSLNAMVTSLRGLLGRISTTTRQLAVASSSIGQASRSMVRAAEHQGNEVTETGSAASEVHQLIDRVAAGVDGLNSAAGESSSSVAELAASIDEVARNMEQLTLSMDGIGDSITSMGNAIEQIDDGVQALMDASTNTASSALEFDTSIRQIEHYARESVAISENVRADAQSGRQAVDATIAGIGDITSAAGVAAEAIGSLSEKAQSIGSIVTVIDDIAQQTNLLALNASIIAAQSGEHGRSFGVVAAEIKQLSERTTRSTKEIAEVIKSVQFETRRAVTAITTAGESIQHGELLSLQAGTALEKIVSGVEQTARQMAEIARATKEQARGSEMIRGAMEQMASMTTAIGDSTRQQQQGSEQIKCEAQKVGAFTVQVLQSLREQAEVSDLISRMALQVAEMSNQIRQACVDQAHGSLRINRSVTSIQQSTTAVLEQTRVVDYGVATLGMQTEALQQEVEQFKL